MVKFVDDNTKSARGCIDQPAERLSGEAKLSAQRGSHIIARTNPIILALLLIAIILALSDSAQTLQENGWLNPEAFFRDNVQFGRGNPYYTVQWFGHVMALAELGYLIVFGPEFARLSMARFNAITFDGQQIKSIGAFRNTGFTPASIKVAERIPPSFGATDWVSISYVKRGRSGRSEGSLLIMSWAYRESVDEIVANLAACGVAVTSRATEDK